jgi:acetyl-CoA C-acetyltransferase
MGDVKAIDAMTHDGLTNPFTGKQMINEASEVSNELEITRPDMDRFAARSHQLAAQATEEGRLAEEIVGVTVKSRKAETTVEADEAIRPDTTVETLAKLPAIGGDDATHTAGNAPGVNDGAGAVIVASEEWAGKEGRDALAHILSYGSVADDFPYLARTPAKAAKLALEKIGRSPEDVPARDIDGALRGFLTTQGRIHPFGDSREVPRVDADECRSELAQRGPHAFREGGQVRAPERAAFPEPVDPVACPDADDSAR